MDTLILEIQKGGLGDHLFYSHIPRIAKESGKYDKVFISNRSLFRHADNKKLVWEINPYVDGFTDEKGIYHSTETIYGNENLLDRLMLLYGLDDGQRFHEPELYYQPELKPELSDAVIYDPNYISYTGDIANGQLIKNWFDEHAVIVGHQMKKLNHRYLPVNGLDLIQTTSLSDFCSLLVSCKRMYCLNTGTATIAAALKIPVTVLYGTGLNSIYRHSKLHEYIHVGTDYGIKEKIKKQLVLFLRRFFKLGVS